MGSLLKVPTEILISICSYLDDIDDIFHLARSCKRVLNIIENPDNQLYVLRSVIRNASHHHYDTQLSYLLALSESALAAEHELLPADAVWAIVSRWRGLRVLYDLYCHPLLRAVYLGSHLPDWLDNECYEEEFVHSPSDLPPLPSVTHYGGSAQGAGAAFSGRSRQAYRRFYKALTAHWTAVETLSLARVTVYSTPEDRDRRFSQIWKIWAENRDRTLQEKLDLIEAFDFVWGFLLRKILASAPSLYDWLGEETIRLCPGGEASDWAFFVRTAIQYLRPPNIIEMLLCPPWVRSQSSVDASRFGYLRALGLFDQKNGICQQMEHDWTRNWQWCWYCPVTVLEYDVLVEIRNILQKADGVRGTARFWEYVWWTYRRKAWVSDARGVLFFREESAERILSRMKTGIGI
ncbi:F-box protein [Aspergillus vadensis CBS 113365]|uniref:F-box domain-containing protein n=1 Tax=Aspergillus vadensis (strain CBS 113365 / IMI 142717 / IBT 24658) TaxID=1448311 RepID=A0A319B426_ASPVC|nr:hypothetical protein BO88DRAFT_344758 [Aspergillus vadensis CBS 113365]PYH67115.1 hypothetical protein BO88DRAFT_344758 [Aspergillus vadensis CBS 113365]